MENATLGPVLMPVGVVELDVNDGNCLSNFPEFFNFHLNMAIAANSVSLSI